MAIGIGRRQFLSVLGGAAAAWPLAAREQQSALPVVGVPAAPVAASYTPYVAAFREGLKQLNYVDGQKVAVELHWTEGHYDRLPGMAAELVARRIAVIATIGGTPAAFAAKAATTTIPIVFTVADDPVKLGLVDNIARPTGNATGISLLHRQAARINVLEQFRQAAEYVDRMLRGEKAGDLPVQRPTKYELVINPKTAKALGLDIPPLLLATTDAVLKSPQ